MTNSKWFPSMLLGGVAIYVMASGAHADELADLKAQLEALQSRVNTIETAPAANVPAGTMLMTASRGQGSNATWGNESARDAANISTDRGFTVAINPTADLPAPVTEITVYGYVKGEASWGNETGGGVSLDMTSYNGGDESSEWAFEGRQSRFGIKAKTDTAIGQIRSKIEGDFYGNTTRTFRLRHAYGEWDMTPNWTFVAGQTWHTASLLPLGVSTVDFSGSAGVTYSRSAQLSMAYKSGPVAALIGISGPAAGNSGDYPDLGARFIYSDGGGHEFFASASVGDDDTGATNRTSWQVGGGANLRLGEIATITAGALYGKGSQARRYLNQEGFANKDIGGNPTSMWGALVGVSMNVSESTTINAQFGYTDQKEGVGSVAAVCAVAATGRTSACVDDVMTIHANIMWRPVKQMRLGWEVQWGRNDYYTAATNSVVKGHFGAWFFF